MSFNIFSEGSSSRSYACIITKCESHIVVVMTKLKSFFVVFLLHDGWPKTMHYYYSQGVFSFLFTPQWKEL